MRNSILLNSTTLNGHELHTVAGINELGQFQIVTFVDNDSVDIYHTNRVVVGEYPEMAYRQYCKGLKDMGDVVPPVTFDQFNKAVTHYAIYGGIQ